MTVSEKVAYLKGLSDGLAIDPETKEGKMFAAIIGTLEEVAIKIDDIEENALNLGEEIDALSDDLADVEDVLFPDDDDEDECGCCCEDEDDCLYSVKCPSCSNEITVDGEILDLGAIECPNCGERLEFDVDDDDDDDEEEDD